MIQFSQNRFSDAAFIQGGACNISGIGHTLVEAARAARDAGVQPANDPAVRLIVHQLGHLTRVGSIDEGRNYNDLCDATEAGDALCRLFDLIGSVAKAAPVDQAAE